MLVPKVSVLERVAGGARLPLCLDQTEAQETSPPPLSQGLDDCPPHPLSVGLDPPLKNYVSLEMH